MLVAIAVPFVIPLFLPILGVFWWVRRRYVTTSREVKRFEGTTRSPVYASFSAALKVRLQFLSGWAIANVLQSHL